MKKILFILGLLISANVYAQPKQIYVGGDVLTVSGDTLYKNGNFLAFIGKGFDSLRVEAGFVQGFKNGTWISQYALTVPTLDDVVLSGDSTGSEINIRGARLWYSGAPKYQTIFGWGANSLDSGTSITAVGYAAGYGQIGNANSFYGVSAGGNNTGSNVSAFGINAANGNTHSNVSLFGSSATADSARQIAFSDGIRKLRLNIAGLSGDRKLIVPDKSGTIALLDDIVGGGGGSDNFPTVDDTLTGNRFLFSDTYNLLFSHASGNAFTLSNTGLSYDIGGNNAISMNSSYNEFKTGNISTYGMLKTTNNTARLYATDGTNTSTVVAHPKYVELDGKDSTVIKNIDEVAIDTATQHVAVLQGNQLKKVKWQTLKADSTLTITGDSISVNRPKALGYREYVASLVQTGTSAPVATVIFSNLPDSVVWEYLGEGIYFAKYYNGGSPQDIESDYGNVSNPTIIIGGEMRIINIQNASGTKLYSISSSGTPKDGVIGANGSIKNIVTIRVYE